MKFLSIFAILIAMSLVFTPVLVRSDEVEEEDAIVDEEKVVDESLKPTEGEEEANPNLVLSSPFVKTKVLFIQPETSDLPAGRLVKLLVGFQNNGTSSFFVDSIDGSFRYPQEFSYIIQNFSVFEYRKVVETERQSTFEYLFTPSETFASRQFGLTINLRYRDAEGKQFVNSVFNDTINVIEPDEGLDGETFLLYIFLAAAVVLLGFAAQQFFSVFKKKSGRSSKTTAQKVQNGASPAASGDIDLEWIPKEHLQTNKSPKVSPRQRKVNGRSNGNAASSGNSSNDEQ